MLLHKPLPHEKIVLVLRRHWFIFFTRLSLNAILLLVPLPLFWFGNAYFKDFLSGAILFPLIVIFFTIYYLALWLIFYLAFIDLYLDVWIITNKRIINIEQFGLFSRSEAEHQLTVIQDVSTEVHGIFQTLLNFGDLTIQTAGESPKVTFKQIPEPYYAKKIISDMIDRMNKEPGTRVSKLKNINTF